MREIDIPSARHQRRRTAWVAAAPAGEAHANEARVPGSSESEATPQPEETAARPDAAVPASPLELGSTARQQSLQRKRRIARTAITLAILLIPVLLALLLLQETR